MGDGVVFDGAPRPVDGERRKRPASMAEDLMAGRAGPQGVSEAERRAVGGRSSEVGAAALDAQQLGAGGREMAATGEPPGRLLDKGAGGIRVRMGAQTVRRHGCARMVDLPECPAAGPGGGDLEEACRRLLL